MFFEVVDDPFDAADPFLWFDSLGTYDFGFIGLVFLYFLFLNMELSAKLS